MPRRPRLRALVMAGVLTAALASGCSDDQPDPDPAAATLVQTGLEQLEAGDPAAAQGTFENVLTLDPENKYAHYNLGLIAQGSDDVERARERYDAALSTDPDFTPALYNRAIIAERDDLEAAVADYRRVVDVHPEFAAAHMRLGFALLHLGQDAEAETALARGVALDPAMADVDAPSYD